MAVGVVTAVAAVLSFRRPTTTTNSCFIRSDCSRAGGTPTRGGFAIWRSSRLGRRCWPVSLRQRRVRRVERLRRACGDARTELPCSSGVWPCSLRRPWSPAPYAVFLQLNGGLVEGLDQMATYARTEGARTKSARCRLACCRKCGHTAATAAPRSRADPLDPPQSDTASVLESRYIAARRCPEGEPGERIWRYEIENISRDNLRALVNDPPVADTALLDRSTLT